VGLIKNAIDRHKGACILLHTCQYSGAEVPGTNVASVPGGAFDLRCLKRYISREVYTILRNQTWQINST